MDDLKRQVEEAIRYKTINKELALREKVRNLPQVYLDKVKESGSQDVELVDKDLYCEFCNNPSLFWEVSGFFLKSGISVSLYASENEYSYAFCINFSLSKVGKLPPTRPKYEDIKGMLDYAYQFYLLNKGDKSCISENYDRLIFEQGVFFRGL